MAKAGEKIKEGAVWVADKILPKSTKETVKDAARKASGIDETIQTLIEQGRTEEANALKKKTDELYGKDASEIIKEAGGYSEVADYAKRQGQKALAEGQKTQAGKFLEEGEDEAREARQLAATESDAANRAAYQAARNTGANRAAASAVGSSVDTRGLQSSAQSAVRNAGTSTQADYLNKLGYANALEQEASNQQKGAFLNNLSGIFSGAGQGASFGASLGGM